MFKWFNFERDKIEIKATEEARLIKLEEKLEELGVCPHNKGAFYFLINFFEIVSWFHEQGELQCVVNAKQMNVLIESTIRDAFVMNSTKKGEEITPEHVFLGKLFNLPTLSVDEWLFLGSKYEGFYKKYFDKDLPDPMDWEIVVKYQVIPFVEGRMNAILKETRKGILGEC